MFRDFFKIWANQGAPASPHPLPLTYAIGWRMPIIGSVLISFMSKIQVFENTDNPQKLPKLIKFEGTAGKFTYYGTLKTLVLDRLKFRTELDGDLRIYELKRSDGWVLKVELFKSIGFPHIYVQFNIFHV